MTRIIVTPEKSVRSTRKYFTTLASEYSNSNRQCLSLGRHIGYIPHTMGNMVSQRNNMDCPFLDRIMSRCVRMWIHKKLLCGRRVQRSSKWWSQSAPVVTEKHSNAPYLTNYCSSHFPYKMAWFETERRPGVPITDHLTNGWVRSFWYWINTFS